MVYFSHLTNYENTPNSSVSIVVWRFDFDFSESISSSANRFRVQRIDFEFSESICVSANRFVFQRIILGFSESVFPQENHPGGGFPNMLSVLDFKFIFFKYSSLSTSERKRLEKSVFRASDGWSCKLLLIMMMIINIEMVITSF